MAPAYMAPAAQAWLPCNKATFLATITLLVWELDGCQASWTLIAKSGHSSSHCMHLMQSSGRTTLTRKTSISRTFFGQNSTQMLHPLQLRSMTSSLALLIPVGLLFLVLRNFFRH